MGNIGALKKILQGKEPSNIHSISLNVLLNHWKFVFHHLLISTKKWVMIEPFYSVSLNSPFEYALLRFHQLLNSLTLQWSDVTFTLVHSVMCLWITNCVFHQILMMNCFGKNLLSLYHSLRCPNIELVVHNEVIVKSLLMFTYSPNWTHWNLQWVNLEKTF